MEERTGGKLLFTENGQLVPRNFSDLVVHLSTGEHFTLEGFTGWVEIRTGSDNKPRPLHLLLSPEDTERLARGYVRGHLKQHDRKLIAWSMAMGWVLRGLLIVLAH